MTTSDDSALLDTNILVYAADTTAAYHESSRALRDRGLAGELALIVTPQVLLEFFAVITDPRRVREPRSLTEARSEMEKYLRATTIRKIYPGDDAFARTLALLGEHPQISRQDIFDCHLVATMLVNGVKRIYTYNRSDFARYQEIEVLTP